MKFSQHSLDKLKGVHPDLVRVAMLAIQRSPVDFGIVYGVRTQAEEAVMVAKGASQTMHSRHLPNKHGFSCAIDVDAFQNGKVDWVHIDLYKTIHVAMVAAARELHVPLEWGGDWKTLKDWGHFQLPWNVYP